MNKYAHKNVRKKCLKNSDHRKNLTISNSSPSSAEPFDCSNKYGQTTLAADVKLLSNSENP